MVSICSITFNVCFCDAAVWLNEHAKDIFVADPLIFFGLFLAFCFTFLFFPQLCLTYSTMFISIPIKSRQLNTYRIIDKIHITSEIMNNTVSQIIITYQSTFQFMSNYMKFYVLLKINYINKLFLKYSYINVHNNTFTFKNIISHVSIMFIKWIKQPIFV